MLSKKIGGLAMGLVGAMLYASPAAATATASSVLIVDDNNVPCPGAKYRTIGDALARAEDGDEIQVCPGVYPEQVVITKQITLQGTPVGSQKVVIRPPALLESRPSVTGGKLITAGILVDVKRVVLDSLVVDMSASNATGCNPVVAGIYLRNASGVVNNVEEFGAHPAAPAACDTGVGLLVESGQAGDVFGQPFFGRAVVAITDSRFGDNQKGGVAVLGNRAIAKVRSSQATGNPGSPTVQNGFEISKEAKGRLLDVSVKNFSTTASGKTATGILLFTASKVRMRRGTLTDMQTGVFVVGDKARVLDTQLGDLSADGIVLLGKKNRSFRNLIDDSSVSGVFIDGDRNLVRGGHMSNMEVGVWFFSGDQNMDAGIDFDDSVVERERVGGSRNLDSNSVDPLTLDCATVADCDDGNPCTTDSCNATTGACSYTNLPNATSCADSTVCNGAETCVAGKCTAGTPLVCVDGNQCTGNVCDPVLGCQFPLLPDGTPCPDGNACNGAETCVAGVCTAGAALVCNDNNSCTTDSCNTASGCQFAPVIDGTPCPDATVCNGPETCIAGTCTAGMPLTCNDNNPCTNDTCDPLLGCQFPAVLDGTPCPDATVCNGDETCVGGVCTAGIPLTPCDDLQECTTDSCDPVLGCQFTPVPDGTSCNGGLGTCTGGVCF